MRARFSLRFLLCALPSLAAFVATAPAVAEPVHTIKQSYFAGDASGVDIELVLGSLAIEGTRGRNVEIEVELTCNRDDAAKCKRRAERIRLRPRLSGEKLYLSLENTPRGRAGGIEATMTVRMPRKMGLEIDIAGGDMKIEDIRGNIEIDSAGGSVDLKGTADRVGTFKADVGFGKGELILRDSRIEASGIPRSITWRGSGSQRIEIDLGGGEITARLD
ncbi:MAG: hypothetical protein AAGM22_15905 [Acidobacteriota bacterium]